MSRPATPAVIRFWPKVDPCRTDGCAVWIGALNKAGYGMFRSDEGKAMLAHHFLPGKPAVGLEYDHLCRNPACVWPSHLEAVTHLVNIRRSPLMKLNGGKPKGDAPCPKGHPVTEMGYGRTTGKRYCRACNRIRSREWWRQRHAVAP